MIVFGCICAHADRFILFNSAHIYIYVHSYLYTQFTWSSKQIYNYWTHNQVSEFVLQLACSVPQLQWGGWVGFQIRATQPMDSLFCCFQHFEPGSKFISVMLNLFPTAILREGNLRNVFAKLPWIRQFYAILRRPCYILYQGHWGKQSCYSVQFSSEIWESRLVMKGMKVKCLSNPLFPF